MEVSKKANKNQRSWDALPEDVVAIILAKVGTQDLIFNIPFTCKAWYKASLNPLSWQTLDFSDWNSISFIKRANSRRLNIMNVGKNDIDSEATFDRLLRFAVNRSRGCVTTVIYPNSMVVPNGIDCIRRRCPKIKMFQLKDIPDGPACWDGRATRVDDLQDMSKKM
ncbi:F-box/LRR-repeat protein At3g48880-like [Magnolia sinica]|uniref:F-box/LRR-repeat protein At3g48880-like n=1 Tax=Magnolia sinica TaxID=86752 RepID=UPI00265A5A58|nr:F-box/LRR-repeat protein At3g48880-like [Magnolia sinica]